MEIEHKFLVKGAYKEFSYHHTHIIQGYLSDDVSRTVRVRICDDSAYLTIKGASSDDGLSRYEWEQAIPLQEAHQLLELCLPGTIDKHRWLIEWAGEHWEIDEFHQQLEGLEIAELEVKSTQHHFELPPFIGTEVTGDSRYYNSQLRKASSPPENPFAAIDCE